MKPGRVAMTGVADAADAIERVLQARLREARNLEGALSDRDEGSLHAFRIACKRLRYALDRVESPQRSVSAAAGRLAELQDALGQAHDRDVLLGILPPTMQRTQRRLKEEREAYADRAAELWGRARDPVGSLALIGFKGLSNLRSEKPPRPGGNDKA